MPFSLTALVSSPLLMTFTDLALAGHQTSLLQSSDVDFRQTQLLQISQASLRR